MNSIILSQRVLNTLNSLPNDERHAIAHALTDEIILGIDPVERLTAIQRMVYAIIRHYVRQDASAMAKASPVGQPIYDLRDLAV